MAFLLSALLGPIVQAFTRNSGSASVDAASASLASTEQADQVSAMATRAQLSHQATKMANVMAVANEHVREDTMYNEFVVANQGAEQHLIQKQMQLLDQSAQA